MTQRGQKKTVIGTSLIKTDYSKNYTKHTRAEGVYTDPEGFRDYSGFAIAFKESCKISESFAYLKPHRSNNQTQRAGHGSVRGWGSPRAADSCGAAPSPQTPL